ncbi:hypothetical protein CO033_00920 [Candidatus Nomurabacteria bacterium CG_4_9_14_0_2_um_filter_32_10]|uniref:2'-5' RNA ligase n=3 Tax=Candidatus Nomuraibacteriota TaxID=1752729 RepID=A0A2H0CG49_9BACT|nr:MAG: hypothetical protein COW91_02305 [Candidatus Nomurabacteria bacterium CG22_combo_CG10-13_8_21_14_all_32_8]PIZ85368.1 MAG: hypothetical protein COX94_02830 [Candidatus Nomurabacteria bacterium CG_4_10_14_0_2_um_filter_33_9]PJC49559.1 MAG: hypothetical protein CO033_00920 [Candidatus Nomurabacteria bacterium CG_4_9_14_0_2_um_filter_32_10]
MENKIAIDIALLLPDKMNKIICDLSNKIIPHADLKPYILNNVNYLPHISILVGTIKIGEVGIIKEKIEQIIKKYLPLKITFKNLITKNTKFPLLDIGNIEELINLRKEIVSLVSLDSDATKEMCFDVDISNGGVDFINNFKRDKFIEESFEFHTTLGLGDASFLNVELPIETVVNTIAICHLGYGCSCRKVLAKIVV